MANTGETSFDMKQVLELQQEELVSLIDVFVSDQYSWLLQQRQALKVAATAHTARWESVIDQEWLRKKAPSVSAQQFQVQGDDGALPADDAPFAEDVAERVEPSAVLAELVPTRVSRPSTPSEDPKTVSSRASTGSMQAESGELAEHVEVFDQLVDQLNSGSVARAVAVLGGCHLCFDRLHGYLDQPWLPRRVVIAAQAIMRSGPVSGFMTAAIFVNALLIAIAVDDTVKRSQQAYFAASAVGESELTWLQGVDVVFACIFTVELVLRLICEEFSFFFGEDWPWNLLDLVIVVSAWLEVIAMATQVDNTADMSLLRLFRMLRVLRSLRVVRLLRSFRELRLILLSLLGSMLPLMWAVLCLFLIVFVFAVVLLQGIVIHVQDSTMSVADGLSRDETQIAELLNRFGSFQKALLSLFKAISGGDDWSLYFDSLDNVSPLYGLLFIIYILLMVLGVLNVITGIFVEGAIAKARSDKELALAEERDKVNSTLKRLMALFKELDADVSGSVSYEEWMKFTSRADAKAALSLLGLDGGKTKDVFGLIDVDGSNVLELEEFVVGCMQLSGSAKMVDVETLLRNNKKLMTSCTQHFDRVEKHIETTMAECFQKTAAAIDRVESHLAGDTLAGRSKV